MDVSKLTPAPWDADESHLVYGRTETLRETQGFAKFESEWRNEDAAFCALARNAFDVMMRRKWWPSWEEDGWRLDDLNDYCAELSEWARENPFPDPFTAIVEADKWCKENIEPGANAPSSSGGAS